MGTAVGRSEPFQAQQTRKGIAGDDWCKFQRSIQLADASVIEFRMVVQGTLRVKFPRSSAPDDSFRKSTRSHYMRGCSPHVMQRTLLHSWFYVGGLYPSCFATRDKPLVTMPTFSAGHQIESVPGNGRRRQATDRQVGYSSTSLCDIGIRE